MKNLKKLFLLSLILMTNVIFSQVLTITEVVKGKTYTINGISSGNELIASEAGDLTVRLYNSTTKTSNNYTTTSSFTDFVINGENPTDIDDAVERINAITNFSATQSPYYLEVQKGAYPDEFIVTKFGRNGSVGLGLTHISISGEYQTPTTAQSLELVSTSADDNPAGIGGHKVIIEGLDSDWNIQKDTVTLNGLTPVPLSKQFIRVYRAYISESGRYVTTTVPSHVGQISLQSIGGATTWFTIDTVEETATGFGIGQTQIGTYSVPKGYTAYLLSKTFSVEANKPASIYFFKRENADDTSSPYTGTMRLFEQNDGIEVPFTINGTVPLNVIKGPAEVGFFAKVSSLPAASISVEFQMLVKKDK